MRWFSLVLLASLTFLVVGCSNNLIGGLLVTKSQKEKELGALRVEFATQLEKIKTDANTAAKQVIDGKNEQIVGASVSLYAADATFDSILTPTRTDIMTNNFVNEAWTALGRPMPTYEAMQATNERIKKELDETKTTLADLKKNHEAALAQSRQLAEATQKYEANLAAAEAKIASMEKEFLAKIDAKQQEVITLNDRLIAAEKARADDREAIQKAKMKFSMIAGALALLAVAGAIYSPVFKMEMGVFGIVCGLIAAGIWYVQPWHIGVVAAVILVGICAWAAFKFRKEEKLSDALVLGTQEIKERYKEDWDNKFKPIISERMKKYVKRDGKIEIREDKALESYVDEKLASWEAK